MPMSHSRFFGIALISVLFTVVPVGANATVITVDFESFPAGTFATFTESGITFSASGGGGLLTTDISAPNATKGLVDTNSPRKELRADVPAGTSMVSVDLGDFDADSDRLFLEIFDAANTSLGFTFIDILGSFTGMLTLALSAPGIDFAIFGARLAVNGSSVFADNFTISVPEPATLALFSIGLAGLGFMTRRRRNRRRQT